MYDQITCTDELRGTLASYEAKGLPAPVDAVTHLNSAALLANPQGDATRPEFITQSFVMETE